MTISKVQSVTGNGATLTLNGVTAANFGCYESSYFRSSTTGVKEATPTDSNGVFTAASNDAPLSAAGDDIGCSIFFVPNMNAGTHTVTPQANTIHNVTFTEYSGIATSLPLDQNISAQSAVAGHLSQATGTTGVTSQASELAVIATALLQAAGGNPVGYTDPVSGFTTLQLGQDTANDIGTQHAFEVLSATGTQSATFNWTTVDNVVCASMACIATFKAAAAGGGTANLSAAGVGVATGTGASTAASPLASTGAGTATAAGASTAAAPLASTGLAVATGTGASTASAALSSSGVATAVAVGAAVFGAQGALSAAGVGTASATGTSVAAAGLAAPGVATAIAQVQDATPPQAPQAPSPPIDVGAGGGGNSQAWGSTANRRRRKRRREEEEIMAIAALIAPFLQSAHPKSRHVE